MRPSTEAILSAVEQVFEVSREELLGKGITKRVAIARCCAYALVRSFCATLSFPDIGAELGRDHPTVMSGISSHLRRISAEPELARLHHLALALAARKLEDAERGLLEASRVRTRVA